MIFSVIGAAIGISLSAPAIAGAGTEKPEVVSKNLISIILAEALAIYGLVVSLLAVSRLADVKTTEQAFRIFSAGLTMGVAAMAAGVGIGTSGSAMAAATVERPELFSKTVIGIIFSEALAIYALVVSLMMITGG